MTVVRTIRLDNTSVADLQEFFKALGKHLGKYLLTKEYGALTGKAHLQGWFEETTSTTNWSKITTKHYNDGKSWTKSFEPCKKFPEWVSYIIKNPSKGLPDFEACITNYTKEEFLNLQRDSPEYIDRKKSHRCRNISPYQALLNHMEDTCVVDGEINYPCIKTQYLEYDPPRNIDAHSYVRACNGIALRLENKYRKNSSCKGTLLRKFSDLDMDGVFEPKNKVYEM